MSNPFATPEQLVHRVAQHGDALQPALIAEDSRAVRFGDALALATIRAGVLEAAGIGSGTVVALDGYQGRGLLVDVLACWLRNAAVTVLDPAIGSWELERRLESARASHRLSGDDIVALGRTRGLSTPGAALVVSTSGTTGSPKAIVLTAGNIAAAVDQLEQRLDTRSGDVVLAALPTFHAAGFVMQLTGGLLGGWTQVVLPRFSASAAWDLIARHGVTHTHLVPRMLELLSADAPPTPPPTLRFVSCGAAPLSPTAAAHFTEATGITVLRGYGLSETGAVAHHEGPADDGSGDYRNVGPAVEGSETRIVDDGGRQLPVGALGEVLLRGPQVANGYVGSEPFPEGWLHTGDLGSVDEQGRLTVSARLKDVIRYNTHQVFPTELEELLLTHPAVVDVVVVGRPDESAGEIPVARVVRRGEVDEQALLAFVADRVAPYRRVRIVEFVDAIERGPLGKPRPSITDQTG